MPIRIVDRIEIAVDPARDLHGPCVIRAANGDLLLCHQDSVEHGGRDGFVHQLRSADNGRTWENEGPAADWRDRGFDALFGEYGVGPDGRLVMLVQRREVLGGDSGIVASWVQVSGDHGRTWREIGPVDGSDTYAVMFGRNLVTVDDTMFAGVWSRHGNALYESSDSGETWSKRSVIFPADYPEFTKLADAGPPFYPHVVICPDGSMLALTYHTPPTHCCFSRRSTDTGASWGPIERLDALPLWAPRMKRFDDETLIVIGRDIEERATVAYFSSDSGRSWREKMVVDRPPFEGSYAYSDSVDAGDGRFWVFTSSPRSPGKGDIVGVLLERD